MAAKEHVEPDAGAHQEQAGEELHYQSEPGRQSELVIDEAGDDEDRAAEQDRQELQLDVFYEVGAQEPRDDQRDHDRREYREATRIGQGFLVEAPGIGLVGPPYF